MGERLWTPEIGTPPPVVDGALRDLYRRERERERRRWRHVRDPRIEGFVRRCVVKHEQTTKTIDNDAGGSTTTGSISLTAGNLLLCIVNQQRGAASPANPTSVKLDGSTDFTLDKGQATDPGGDDAHRVSLHSLANIPGGSHTVTVNYAAGPNRATVFLMEVSGCATASYQDGSGASKFTATTTTPNSGSFSASNSNDFWIAAMVSASSANPATVTAGSGWAIPTNGSETNGASNCVSGVEYIENPGVTSEDGTWTASSAEHACLVFAYKAGTPPTPNNQWLWVKA